MKTKTSLILTVAALALSGSALAEVKIALVAKSLGNGFFEEMCIRDSISCAPWWNSNRSWSVRPPMPC